MSFIGDKPSPRSSLTINTVGISFIYLLRMLRTQLIRGLHTSAPRLQGITTPPVRRVGALRGGFTGFLFGVAVTGGAAYYYLLDEYNAGQKAILADVITLRSSLKELNEQVNALKKDAKSN